MQSRGSIMVNKQLGSEGLQKINNNDEDKRAELLKKSSKFMIGEREHTFNLDEAIFLKQGPSEKQKKKEKCPTCRYVFTSSSEMLFCEFCSLSNCHNCLKKTRLFPKGPKDAEGNRTLRGKICKLCDRKFFILAHVEDSLKKIDGRNVTIWKLKNDLKSNGQETKEQLHEDEDKAQSVAQLLQESETQLQGLHQQIGNLEKELVAKDEENGRIYKEKMRLEDQMTAMQKATHQMDSVYVELLELRDELKLVKDRHAEESEYNTNNLDENGAVHQRNNWMMQGDGTGRALSAMMGASDMDDPDGIEMNIPDDGAPSDNEEDQQGYGDMELDIDDHNETVRGKKGFLADPMSMMDSSNNTLLAMSRNSTAVSLMDSNHQGSSQKGQLAKQKMNGKKIKSESAAGGCGPNDGDACCTLF